MQWIHLLDHPENGGSTASET